MHILLTRGGGGIPRQSGREAPGSGVNYLITVISALLSAMRLRSVLQRPVVWRGCLASSMR